MPVPAIRVHAIHDFPVRPDGQFVLYWMIANRRSSSNYALDRAVDWANELNKPLVVLEPLDCALEWTSDRTHRFLLQGMIHNHLAFGRGAAFYYPYAETQPNAGRGLLASLSAWACIVVTDQFPAFIYPQLVRSAAKHVAVRFEMVDSCGLLPLDGAERVFLRAFSFRRFLEKNLQPHLEQPPLEDPLSTLKATRLLKMDPEITSRWPISTVPLLSKLAADPGLLPIDHSVSALSQTGGSAAAHAVLNKFLESGRRGASGLSPYIHFGHIGVHDIYNAAKAHMNPEFVHAFLDQLVTWRELGFNMCAKRTDHDQYESLPNWAQATLAKHAMDRRPFLYSQEQLELARTHDQLWNEAQLQLVNEGKIDSYLRMLWGKKILEWSPSPQRALAVMIELNNKYALDGRDPNSYNGIFWTLGRYDRPWGPERPIFGLVRYMSSQSAARKLRRRQSA